jgi:hypothetical protein
LAVADEVLFERLSMVLAPHLASSHQTLGMGP